MQKICLLSKGIYKIRVKPHVLLLKKWTVIMTVYSFWNTQYSPWFSFTRLNVV